MDRQSPWTIAVKNAYDDAIKYFLSNFDKLECDYMVEILKEYYMNYENFDFNQEFEGEPLLYYAINKGNDALRSFFIQKGANVCQKGLDEKVIHDYALKQNFLSIFMSYRVKRLMKKSAVNRNYENGDTKLHLAAQNADTDEIISLLEAGAYYNIKNEKGETPKDIAKLENKTLFNEIDKHFNDARNNSFDFVTISEKWIYIYSTRDENGKTLLHYAAMKDNVEAVNNLVNASDENELDSEAKTPIYYAVKNNNKEILKIMLNEPFIDFSTLVNTTAYKEIEENDCKILISLIKKTTDFAFNENIDDLNDELGLIKNNKDFNFIVKVQPLDRMCIVDYALKYPDIALDLLQKGIVAQQLEMSGRNAINYKPEKLILILIQIAEYLLSKKIEPDSIIKYFNNIFIGALKYCINVKFVARSRLGMKKSEYLHFGLFNL